MDLLSTSIEHIIPELLRPIVRKDRLGNPVALWITLLIVLIITGISYFKLPLLYYTLAITPLLYLPYRWFRIKHDIHKMQREKQQDVAAWKTVEYLLSKILFEWEIRTFLLPRLIFLFRIGSSSL